MRQLCALALAAFFATSASAEEASLSRAEVETIVRETLLANPEILEEAFTILQQRRLDQETAERTAVLEDNREALTQSPNDGILGNPDGDVTLVEFFDYNCGYCRRAMGDMKALIEADPNLRVVMKEFPVLGQPSMEAAAVSISVHALYPDAYDEFHHRLMSTDGPADGEAALQIADELDLPRDELEANMRSDSVRAVMEESYKMAQALGLSGTPSYVIGNTVEFGAVGFDQLRARINEERCGAVTC